MPRPPESGAHPADPVPGRPDPDVPLLLLHVPRTGGSTLKFMLREVHGADRTLLDAHRFPTEPLAGSGLAVIEGHVSAPFFARAFGPDWPANAVTLLRDPVARVVSQARHIRARPGPLQSTLAAPVTDPDALFGRLPRLADLQTKLLAGHPIDEPADEGALGAACATLDRMAFGSTEDLDLAVALGSERFRFGAVRFGVTNAAAPTGDDDLRSAAFRTAAEAHNRFDVRLRAHADRVLAERVERFTTTLLDLPLAEAGATGAVRFLRRDLVGPIRRPAPGVRGRISGWVLVDGHAPDAVLVRAGDRVVPLVPRVHRDEAARSTGRIADRRAGFVGTLGIPPEATTVELIAFDRARGRRAVIPFAVEEPPRRSAWPRLVTGRRRRS